MKIIKLLIILLFFVGVMQATPIQDFNTTEESVARQTTNPLVGSPLIGPGSALAINFFIPFGIGSYLQGDYKSGIAQSVLDTVAFSFYGVAASLAPKDNKIGAVVVLFIIGGLANTTSWIVGLTTPFIFYKKYYAFSFDSYLPPLLRKSKIKRDRGEKPYNFNLYTYRF